MAKDPDKRLRRVSELLSCEGYTKESLFPLRGWAFCWKRRVKFWWSMDKVPTSGQWFAVSHRFSLQGDKISIWWRMSVLRRWRWPVWHDPHLPPPPKTRHVRYSLLVPPTSPQTLAKGVFAVIGVHQRVPQLFLHVSLETCCTPNRSHVIQVTRS